MIRLHASPAIEGAPWFDDVLIFGGTKDHGTTPLYEVARLHIFLSIQTGGKGNAANQSHMMALVHNFCALGYGTRGTPVLDLYAPESMCRYNSAAQGRAPGGGRSTAGRGGRAFNIPFPMMELSHARNGDPHLCLIDTESISAPLWTERNLDKPGLYWIFREPGDAMPGYDLSVHYDELSDPSSMSEGGDTSSEEEGGAQDDQEHV